MLGLSEGTVKVQSQPARAVLRRMLAEEPGTLGEALEDR
jgi:hypothetical protein